MKIFIVSSVYKQKVNGDDNWCTAAFRKKETAQKLIEKTEKRDDIRCCYLTQIDVCED